MYAIRKKKQWLLWCSAALLSGCSVTLTSDPVSPVEAESGPVVVTSAGSPLQFTAAPVSVAVSPALAGGAEVVGGSITRGADGSVTFEVDPGVLFPRTYAVSVTQPGSPFMGSLSLRVIEPIDPWADAVVSVAYGPGAGFGQGAMPGVVLGPPQGGGYFAGSLDVLVLGEGGTITLAFENNSVVDEEGPDLAVYENVIYIGGNPFSRFMEVATVEASADGLNWYAFPFSEDAGFPTTDPRRWPGYAGVNCTDPIGAPILPPAVPCGDGSGRFPGIGGDLFDLADLGLDAVQFVRITDAPVSGTFDLDAVAAIHAGPPLE